MATVRKGELWLLGDGAFPQGKFTLSEELVGVLPELLAACQQLQPALDMQSLIRAIWLFGIKGVRHRQERHIPVQLDRRPIRPRS